MTKDVLEYKGYVAKVTFDAEEHLLRGKVQGIVDSVDFESDSLTGVETAFQDAVDRYLAFCSAVGRRPARAFKGNFNVRIGSNLHKQMAVWAMAHDMTLNGAVEQAVQEFVERHK